MGKHSSLNRLLGYGLLMLFSIGAMAIDGVCQDVNDTILSDPLFAKPEVSLEDLQAALQDPERAERVIELHFTRAKELSREQQRDFLRKALGHESLAVRRQAVEQLQRLGMLEEVISEQVQVFGPRIVFSFKSALVKSVPKAPPLSAMQEDSIADLLERMASTDNRDGFAAQSQLEQLGLAAVPGLLAALDDEKLAPLAAASLGRTISQAKAESAVAESAAQTRDVGTANRPAAARPKVRMGTVKAGQPQPLVRSFGEDQPVDVQVYFGTNRETLEAKPKSNQRLLTGGILVLVAILASIASAARVYYQSNRQRIGCVPLMMFGLLVLIGIMGLMQFNAAWLERYSLHEGIEFGNRRSPSGEVSYGFCHVSIPPTHQVGQVERPAIGAESQEAHVVVKSTEVLDDETFYEQVRQILATEKTDGECFVFVHGYNVTFEDAARRTAQIHYDLRFSGVPIFFSWPSRGGFHHYFSDRNEILVSHQVIKQFLSDVAKRAKAQRIHVIAHSMGADATCRAIAELDQEGRLFEQIVLAAPDIDTAYFEGQLLPEIMPKAKRTTLYCSRNDWALYASDRFNDGPRAGDSSDQVIVAPGLDTVDASDMDTELLGHSYYGSCMPLIEDVRMLLAENLPPVERRLIAQETEQNIPFWMFDLSADEEVTAEQDDPQAQPPQ